MEEVQQGEEVHGLGGAPFLTRAAYEEALARGTACQFVVPTEQQADQQQQSAQGTFILPKFKPKASTSPNGYADLPILQPALVPSPIIKKGEESSPSSFVPLSAQVTIPPSCPLNTEAGHNSKSEADTDQTNLDILMPPQLAPMQLKVAAYQKTKREDARSWVSSLDEDCSKEDSGVEIISVSYAQENNDASFIFIL